MTKYEEKIYNIINNSNSHMTSEEVFFELKKEEPKVVLATIYNNLNRLVEKGLIKKLSFINQSDRYDKMIKHDHLICANCGCITDFSFSDITKSLEKDLGEVINGYDLRVTYICPKCRKK